MTSEGSLGASVVVVVSKISGGAVVRGIVLVDVTGAIVGVVVGMLLLVCGGVVACGRVGMVGNVDVD